MSYLVPPGDRVQTRVAHNDSIDPMETDAVDHISSETGGGVDIAFEVAGIETTFNDAIGSTRPSGTV